MKTKAVDPDSGQVLELQGDRWIPVGQSGKPLRELPVPHATTPVSSNNAVTGHTGAPVQLAPEKRSEPRRAIYLKTSRGKRRLISGLNPWDWEAAARSLCPPLRPLPDDDD